MQQRFTHTHPSHLTFTHRLRLWIYFVCISRHVCDCLLNFTEFRHCHLQLTWVTGNLAKHLFLLHVITPVGKLWIFFDSGPYCSSSSSDAHAPWDTQRQYKQSHIMDSRNKLTLGSGWCSTQLMPVLIRAWKYYLGLAARSKKSILSQVINSALSDCSPIPGSPMSLSCLLPLKFSLWLALLC